MTWFLPILCSIFSDCPGLSLFALNNTYQSVSSNQVSVFLFFDKEISQISNDKNHSYLSMQTNISHKKNIIVKKNKFETINQQCSPKATNKITPNLGNVIWVGRKK